MAAVLQYLLAFAFLHSRDARFFALSQLVRKILFHKTPKLLFTNSFDTTPYWQFGRSVSFNVVMAMIIPELAEIFAAHDRGLAVLGRPKLFLLMGKA